MCDIRLFKSARADLAAAESLWQMPSNDELILNIVAYHLQQSVEKLLKAALECTGVTVPNTHKIDRLVKMVYDNGAYLAVTDWIDSHAEMLSSWEAESRYDMDFLVEKRKLDTALKEVRTFFDDNGIRDEIREELKDPAVKAQILECIPVSKRDCSDFELNCYYILFHKSMHG